MWWPKKPSTPGDSYVKVYFLYLGEAFYGVWYLVLVYRSHVKKGVFRPSFALFITVGDINGG